MVAASVTHMSDLVFLSLFLFVYDKASLYEKVCLFVRLYISTFKKQILLTNSHHVLASFFEYITLFSIDSIIIFYKDFGENRKLEIEDGGRGFRSELVREKI